MNGSSNINNGDSMRPSSSGSTTVLKYEKSSCLFCNEWFDSQTFTEHLIHCGQVLEQCPNTCNVFVPRIRMRAHLKECPRNRRRSASLERLDQQHVDQRVQVVENEITTLRSVLNEEIRQRLHLITDVGNLRKQNQIHDEWNQATEEHMKSVQNRLEEEATQRTFEVEQCQTDFRYCYDITQTLKSEIQNEIDDLEKHINQMSLDVTQHQNHLNDNIMQLEETVLMHEKNNRDKFDNIENFLQSINLDLNTKLSLNDEQKSAALALEVKSMKHIVCDTEERCDKLEALVTQIDKNLHHTMQLVSDLENHIATQQRLTSYINSRGHLIWRIKDFSKKLEEAKHYDTILHSAMFSNKPFGYALRLDIYLNGKGTWKGRNILACLNVIAGEYDPLLPWPCRLQADVIIRDQNLNPTEPEDFIKTISVRKKSDDYIQTKQCFYIPHTILNQRNYVKNDCLFVEVKILK